MMQWLSFLVNIGAAGGFVLVCALYAKRIGGVGPWLVASLGVIDALLLLMFRVHALMGRDPTKSFVDIEREYLVLDGLDALATFTSAIFVLVGFAIMMTPPKRT